MYKFTTAWFFLTHNVEETYCKILSSHSSMPVCRAAGSSVVVANARVSSNRKQKNRVSIKSQVAGYEDPPDQKNKRTKPTMPHMPSIDRRIYSGLFRKKVIYGKGEKWQSHLSLISPRNGVVKNSF